MKSFRCQFLCMILLISVIAPVVAMSEAPSRSSTGSKYISNWELTQSNNDPFDDICHSDDDYLFYGVDSSIFGEQFNCQNMDFDDAGNIYFVFSDNSAGSIGGYSYYRGINIVKIDISGNVEYIVNIDSDNSSVIPQMVVVSSEDVFYISFSSYSSTTFTFTPTIQVTSSGSYSEIIAYHSLLGWQWAIEAGPASRKSIYRLGNYHWEIASDGSLVTLSNEGEGGQCYPQSDSASSEYRLIKYDIADGSLDWYRTIDTCYSSIGDDFAHPNSIFIDGGNIYLYVESTIKITLHGNSQNCDGAVKVDNNVVFTGCQMFARYSNQGQLSWSKTITHTGVYFTNFNPVSNGILMSGIWGGGLGQNYTNYSGDIHWAPDDAAISGVGVSIAKLDFNGAWNYHHTWGGEDGDLSLANRIIWDDDDDFIIATPFYGMSFEIDSTHSVHRSVGDIGTAIFAYSATGQFQWSSSLTGTGGPIPYGFAASNSNAMFVSVGSVNFGQTYSAPDNAFAAAWIGLDDGVWSDFEGNLSIWPVIGVTSDGAFLTLGVNNNQYSILSWAEDIDADDIPPSDDNCVDDWNPSQSDYDSDGDGDVCDDDDDNDTIPDVADICPLGELDWISIEVLDHDGDGCLDQSEEDRDDDNDGLSDQLDLCPVGILGFGNDRDGDGCKDSEDSDDDNDGVHDGSDFCHSLRF
jgi:hypothetical protein